MDYAIELLERMVSVTSFAQDFDKDIFYARKEAEEFLMERKCGYKNISADPGKTHFITDCGAMCFDNVTEGETCFNCGKQIVSVLYL